MRTEATLEQWKTLYELTLQLKAMEPWRFFENLDLLAVNLPDNDPVYISILGKYGLNYGINLYQGNDALLSFLDLVWHEQSGIPKQYLYFNQDVLCCEFGNREDVPTEQYKVIKSLGYRFRGKNQWVFFSSLKPYFQPYLPDQDEVIKMTQVFEQLIPLVESYINGEYRPDFANSEILIRKYDQELDEWSNEVETLQLKGWKATVIEVDPNAEMYQWLETRPMVEAELELDMNFLYSSIHELEDTYGRPINPKIILMTDHIDGYILHHELITDPNEEHDTIFKTLLSFFEKFGIPKAIHFRLPVIGHLLEELSAFLRFELIFSQDLPASDAFYQELFQ